MNMATPALGPSLGMAPAGTCTWMSDFSNTLCSTPSDDARALTRLERRLRALLHHVAELAGEDQPAAAGHAGALDEQDVAAGRRPGKPGRHAGHARAHRHLALEAAAAEDRVQIGGSIRMRSTLPSATRMATWWQIAPISRSRLRTPASRV